MNKAFDITVHFQIEAVDRESAIEHVVKQLNQDDLLLGIAQITDVECLESNELEFDFPYPNEKRIP